ncbi:MAG: hypothetical protein EXR72_11740 [Myxococcales bacterium]|nr:hypothetical protein [Myxococcales bacterium]
MSALRWPIRVAVLSLAVACQSVPLPPPGSDGYAAVDAATPPIDAAAARDQALQVSCGAGGASTFPEFDRACAAAQDCFIALHQINCCGSLAALGLSGKEKGRFEAAEKICEAQYPGCGCASQPTVADDGKSESQGHPIAVSCVAGKCRTSVAP